MYRYTKVSFTIIIFDAVLYGPYTDDVIASRLPKLQEENRTFVLFCVGFCTGHFVMVPILTYLHVHCLQHSFFEHLFNLFYFNRYFIITVCLSKNVYFHKYVTELDM